MTTRIQVLCNRCGLEIKGWEDRPHLYLDMPPKDRALTVVDLCDRCAENFKRWLAKGEEK